MQKSINEYNQEDKMYFKKIVLDYEELCKKNNRKVIQAKSKHIAKHPTGQINIAIYDPKTDIMKQYNCVTRNNRKGTSQMIYKVHN